MFKKLPYIQIFTAMYVLCIAVYMLFNISDTPEHKTFWINYYWIVNKGSMLIALVFNKKRIKTEVEDLTINFLIAQTAAIFAYFIIGLPFYKDWMVSNDAVVYSFFVGSFIALGWMWYQKRKGLNNE